MMLGTLDILLWKKETRSLSLIIYKNHIKVDTEKERVAISRQNRVVFFFFHYKIVLKPAIIKKGKKNAFYNGKVFNSIQKEALIILNIYALNTGAPRFLKQVLIGPRRDLDNHTITVGNFNMPLTVLDRSSRQK